MRPDDLNRPDSSKGGESIMPTKFLVGDLRHDDWAYIAAALQLTKREREVMVLTCAGATRKDMADALGVTVGAVSAYSHRLYKKAGCGDRLTFKDICREIVRQRQKQRPEPYMG